MAKDDTESTGLFSKMVKFVRSPGTQWSDMDQQRSAKDGSLSKQALKEMIERKRRNDFVRKREFDMLRKLQQREALGGSASDAGVRPSFFQSSMPSRPDDRAMTIKKIDEIEAQMSMQWWKTKHGAAGGPTSVSASSDFSLSNAGHPQITPHASARPAAATTNAAYARTVVDELQNGQKPGEMQSGAGAVAAASSASGLTVNVPVANSHAQPAGLPQSTPRFSDVPAIKPFSPSTDSAAAARPAFSAAAPTAPAGAASPADAAASDNHNSLDFTVDFALEGKPLIKPSSFSTPAQPDISLAAMPASAKARGMLGSLAASYDASGSVSGFSSSKLFALEVADVQHDPELEEASIRFANGDDAGAEQGLMEAIGAHGSRHQHEEAWLTLFDLYRATSQYDRFESLAIDFASKFNRSSPMWFSIPEMVSKMTGSAPPTSADLRKADWKSPAVFGIQSVAALKAALNKASMPWTLDFASLKSIEDNAVAPLAKLLIAWTLEPVQIRMSHAGKLEDVLRQGTPSGVRTVDQERWNLLLAYMRVAHRPDEFELAALDFCVTYEVSPPSWESSRCEFKVLDAEGNTGVGQTIVGDAIHDSVMSELQTDAGTSMMTAQMTSVELSGQIMGEPGPALDKLENKLMGADVMVISCQKLVRVDFSAAGSLLNWVSARQAEGRIVHFTEVHRLVAAFFHVIGISEHAKVSPRID